MGRVIIELARCSEAARSWPGLASVATLLSGTLAFYNSLPKN